MGFRYLDPHGRFVKFSPKKPEVKGSKEVEAKPEIKSEPAPEVMEVPKELDKLPMSELKKMAKSKGLKIDKKLKKGDIINAIEEKDSEVEL